MKHFRFLNLKPFISMLIACLMLAVIGCSGSDTVVKEVSDSGGATEAGNPGDKITISGYAQKGPFMRHSNVWLYELDNDFEPTGRIFQEMTGKDGHFSIPANLDSDYIKLSIVGAFFDEISYNGSGMDDYYIPSTLLDTSTLASVEDNNDININILTIIAKDTILAHIENEGMSFDEAYTEACEDVFNAFDMPDDITTLFEDMVMLEKPGSTPTEGNKILLAVSAIMMQMAHDRCGDNCSGDSIAMTLNNLIKSIAEDIADNNEFDDDISALMETAIMKLEHTKIRSHMEEEFSEYTIPRFEDYIIGDLNIRWTGVNCAASGITTIDVEIDDIVTGSINDGPWPCNEQQGTIIGLNAGTYDTVRLIFKNELDEIMFSAEKNDVTIEAGQTSVLNIEPSDFSSGSVSIEWDIDCIHSGVSTLNAWIFDDLENLIKTSDTFNCSDGKMVIGNIEDFTDGRIVLVFRDINSTILFQSDITGVDVSNGNTTIIGPFEIIQPEITSPLADDIFLRGEPITFSGTGYDYSGNPLSGSSLVWASDIEGQIGTGNSFTSSLSEEGLHTITLTALDPLQGELNVSIPIHIYLPENTVLVGPGETYETIQSAVNAVDPGYIIIVNDGTYTENIRVTKEVVIRSQNGYSTTTIIAADPTDNVLRIYADNVTIDGFTLYGAVNNIAGIYASTYSNLTIVNNRCGYDALHNNFFGIYIRYGTGHIISNNISSYNIRYGILLLEANSITVEDNICSYNDMTGIGLSVASNSTVSNNTCSSNNTYGLRLDGGVDVGLSDNTISGNIITDNGTGIWMRYNLNNTFFDNDITQNALGIRVHNSMDNFFYLNNFDNTNNISSIDVTSSNNWHSPNQLTYTYLGTEYTSYLGNYYSSHDLTDSDGDGVTDNPYNMPTSEPDDEYPLADTVDNYE